MKGVLGVDENWHKCSEYYGVRGDGSIVHNIQRIANAGTSTV